MFADFRRPLLSTAELQKKRRHPLANLEATSIGANGSPRKCHPWNENGKRKTMETEKLFRPRNFDMTGPMHSVTQGYRVQDGVQRTYVQYVCSVQRGYLCGTENGAPIRST